MSATDGAVGTTTKIFDTGPAAERWNLVILAEGYQAGELGHFATDAETFVNTFKATAPFDTMLHAINVYRVDVSSTDSGADDPGACGDGSAGTGTTVATYFDATFCGGGQVRRLLTINQGTALDVATAAVPEVQMVVVIVNSPTYGGSGGQVSVFSTNAQSVEIGLHEMGHSAFGLADEYESYAGCGLDVGHDRHPAAEPSQPNVTIDSSRATIKWSSLVDPGTAMPTTFNPDCTVCDPQPSPVPAGTVGAFEGAHYYHCGAYRPEYNCRMRTLSEAYCAVCRLTIVRILGPYMRPRVTALAPASGPVGTSVVITGEFFTDALSVGFGVTETGSMAVDSDTQITATAPDGSGDVDVTVISQYGTSPMSAADVFSYVASPVPIPVVTGISPLSGVPGTNIEIAGSGFTGATDVGFGDTNTPWLRVDSDTHITAEAPGGSGTVDVVVIGPGGSSALVLDDQFTFTPAGIIPSVDGVDPTRGGSGTSVVISGSGFTGATSVGFGSTGAAWISVDSDSQITALAPTGTGTVDITVIGPGGTSAIGPAGQFTYVPAAAPPAVTGVSPSTGSPGSVVVITGSGFTGATSVGFGNTGVPVMSVDSEAQITVQAPFGSGTVDVVVFGPAGWSPAVPGDQFTYVGSPVPTVGAVDPASGPEGAMVVVSGSGFSGATSIGFGFTGAVVMTIDSDTQITTVAPPGNGTVDVTVFGPQGSSVTSPSDQFTYTP